jgi:hypothetical protein
MDITTQKFEFWCEEHQTHLELTNDALTHSWTVAVVSQVVNENSQTTQQYEFDLSAVICPTSDYEYAEDSCIKSWQVRTVE